MDNFLYQPQRQICIPANCNIPGINAFFISRVRKQMAGRKLCGSHGGFFYSLGWLQERYEAK